MSKTNHSRRDFLRNAATAAAIAAAPAGVGSAARAAALVKEPVSDAVGTPITNTGEFCNIERGNPIPYKVPIEKLREIGMVRETWQLEILADPKSNSKVTHPMLKANGTALTFDALMKIAATKAVSYLKVVTCNNMCDGLGQGLWEGVPLRDVLWLTDPEENVRQVYYYGFHNEDPKQLFKCYLPMNRIFEDPPGELPVMLCYKLNGEFLTGQRGGPVRMIVPEAYGFKNVKWIQRILFTNDFKADDTYAGGNNDVNGSWLKTVARFRGQKDRIKAADPLTIHGMAQVGISGLAKVQYCILKGDNPLPPEDDPYFTKAAWEELRRSSHSMMRYSKVMPGPAHPNQFDPATKQPKQWPIRYTLCRWTAEPRRLTPGKYILLCRTIDLAGYAQPMPRPFGKSGKNAIETVPLEVT